MTGKSLGQPAPALASVRLLAQGQASPLLLKVVSLKRGSRGVATCPSSRRAPGRAGCPLPPSPQRAFSPPSSRIGRKAAVLLQVLISAVFGLSIAFVTSFELYMFLRFVVATATSGIAFSTINLRGYLSPEAFMKP